MHFATFVGNNWCVLIGACAVKELNMIIMNITFEPSHSMFGFILNTWLAILVDTFLMNRLIYKVRCIMRHILEGRRHRPAVLLGKLISAFLFCCLASITCSLIRMSVMF